MSDLRFETSGHGIEKAHSHLQVAGSLVPFTVERPNRRRFPADISDDVVIYLTGWTESEDSIKPVRQATAQLGMAAVTLYHPRYYNPAKVLRAAHLRVENVAAMVGALQDDFASVSLAGHSMGGIDAVRATHENDLDINVLAVLGSAGLIRSDNFQHVAPRVFNEIVQEEGAYLLQDPIHEGKFAFESLKTILRNPALAASEGIAAATHYVGRHIEGLAARGIVTANVMADSDKISRIRTYLQVPKTCHSMS